MPRRYCTAPAIASRKAAVKIALSHISCSSRGGPGKTTTVGPEPPEKGTTRPGAVPTGSNTVAPAGTTACLRFASEHGVGIQVSPAAHQRPEDLGDLRLELLVEHHLATTKLPDDLGRQVVRRGPQPPARNHQRHARSRHETQRVHQIIRAIPHNLDHRRVHPQPNEALGQPRSVAVGDDPGQHLGASDQDPGPDGGAATRMNPRGAHVQVGSWPADSSVVFPGVSA